MPVSLSLRLNIFTLIDQDLYALVKAISLGIFSIKVD